MDSSTRGDTVGETVGDFEKLLLLAILRLDDAAYGAAIIAELVSELVDTEIYHLFVSRVTTRYQWLRVLVSNSVSVPIDNLLFVLIAFSPFAFLGAQLVDSWAVAVEIFLFNLLVKYGVTLVSMPLIYLTPDRDWA